MIRSSWTYSGDDWRGRRRRRGGCRRATVCHFFYLRRCRSLLWRWWGKSPTTFVMLLIRSAIRSPNKGLLSVVWWGKETLVRASPNGPFSFEIGCVWEMSMHVICLSFFLLLFPPSPCQTIKNKGTHVKDFEKKEKREQNANFFWPSQVSGHSVLTGRDCVEGVFDASWAIQGTVNDEDERMFLVPCGLKGRISLDAMAFQRRGIRRDRR